MGDLRLPQFDSIYIIIIYSNTSKTHTGRSKTIMGDLRLPQFDSIYDQNKMGSMVDTLENTFANISSIFAQVRRAAYQIFADVDTISYTAPGEETLMTYDLQPNVLAQKGYNIEVKAWGQFAVNSNQKIIRMCFGSVTIYNNNIDPPFGGSWLINATIVRVDDTNQQAIVTISSTSAAIQKISTYTMLTETLSDIVTIKCTGMAVTDGDIEQNGMLIKVVPQE